MPPSITYGDLGARVFPAGLPAGLADELPTLYNSLFSTLAWFEGYEHTEPTGACVLDEPRHVLLFTLDGHTIDILNKVFEIPQRDVERAAWALFRALPDARRIHIEVLFDPRGLRLPRRVLYGTDHMVIELPDTVDAYLASLGKKTRSNLRNFENRLRKDHPDVVTTVLPPGERTQEHLERLIQWKNERYAALGRPSFWNTKPETREQFGAVMTRCCETHVTEIDGEEAAIRFVAPVGTDMFAVQGAFDPRYQSYRLGSLSQSWVVRDAVRRGARRLSFLWGSDESKRHLGARPLRATRLSVFPTHRARLSSLPEGREVLMRTAKTGGRDLYERSLHQAGSVARRLGLRQTATSGD